MVMLGNNQFRYKKAIMIGTMDSLNKVLCPLTMKCEWSLAVGHINMPEIDTINESLKDLGLSLNDPDIWIEDAGATTHNTAYLKNAVNHRAATAQDNIVGVTGPPAKQS
jgi:hypothetical protein